MENNEKCSNSLDKGLLVLRIGIGIIFLFHGVPKLMAGSEMWGNLGMSMGYLGIHFAPVFWGFMAAMVEALGGLLLIFGIATRMVAFLMLVDMIIAMIMHFATGGGFMMASHAMSMAVVFLALMISGPGMYSLCCSSCCCHISTK